MLATLVLFLAAAVLAVPLSRRLGLGAVLGYLFAGMLIGPRGLGWVNDFSQVLELSSFGIALMMFVIGLELQPSRLWNLRSTVFGLGAAQVLVTTLLFALVAAGLGLGWRTALTVGFGLSMSSTAFVLQMLAERNELTSHHGRAAFGILLFQDLAAVPVLALLPLLAAKAGATDATLWHTLRAVAVVAAIVLGGRYLLRPLLRLVASMQMPELFTAAALLVVAATALAVHSVGLSEPLGAFLAGVLLADSEYRHELEADIQPFKGLLLGLFFMGVGLSANLELLRSEPLVVLGCVLGLVTIKALVIYGLGLARGRRNDSARALGAALAQGGEFAYVLFGVGAAAGLLSDSQEDLLVVIVTVSMLVTPPLYALQARFRREEETPPFDEINVPENEVIIAGFGTFGQIFGRMLRVKKIPYTVLEKNWQHVDFVRTFGNRVFYSDASRLEVLRAARADKARYFVLAIADPKESLPIAENLRRHFPHLQVFACAADRRHAMQLMELGINNVIRRSYGSSLEMVARFLQLRGEPEARVQRDLARFREHDHRTLLQQFAVHRDEQKLMQTAKDAARELEQLFEADTSEQEA